MSLPVEPIVSASWLQANLNDERLVILNATLPKAGNSERTSQELQIVGARFIDIKRDLSDTTARFPNTRLSPEQFQAAARKAGIDETSIIVVYDEHGIYSAARVWWQFKSMGHEQIYVLDGGLPEAMIQNLPLEPKKTVPVKEGNFIAVPEKELFVDIPEVKNNLESQEYLVLDARSANRFSGREEEPRAGLRSGHIPASKNLPYTDLLESQKLKDKTILQALFKEINPANRPLYMSCGSGITACILALGAELAGIKDIKVYDGSWTEWGSIEELPVEKN